MIAATHFLISFAMLRLEAPAAFGTFTFLFVAAQITIALSTALFGAPLQALSSSLDTDAREHASAAIVTAAVGLAMAAGLSFGLLASIMNVSLAAAICYGLYTATMIIRWVGRAWSYAADRPVRTAISDIGYGAVTLGAFGIAAYVLRLPPERASFGALALGSTASLIAFGRSYAPRLLAPPTRQAWHTYRAIWRHQSRWALLGVVTMETVANVHIYMVTIVAGAAAVAPLAATALLFRPINVVQNALGDFERSQIARLIADGSLQEVRRTKRLFLAVLLAAWTVSAAIAVSVVLFVPSFVFSQDYDLTLIEIATFSWVLVTLLILLQMPANVMLQATGDFERLARATIWSSLVNVIAVAAVLVVFEPVWTIAVMAIGWLVDLILVRRAAAYRWRLLDTRAVSGL